MLNAQHDYSWFQCLILWHESAGNRTLDLPRVKRTLYHLGYTPGRVACNNCLKHIRVACNNSLQRGRVACNDSVQPVRLACNYSLKPAMVACNNSLQPVRVACNNSVQPVRVACNAITVYNLLG